MYEDIYEQWFRKAMAMQTGEKLHLPVESKQEQTKLKNMLTKIRDSFKGVDASIEASKVIVYTNLVKADRKFYVVLEKRAFSPLIGFITNDQNEELKKVTLSPDMERTRRIRLMVLEGWSKEKIEEAEGELSPEDMFVSI
jgi:hypothetical protein